MSPKSIKKLRKNRMAIHKLLRGHSDSDEDLSQNKKQCVFSLISINNTEVSFNI